MRRMGPGLRVTGLCAGLLLGARLPAGGPYDIKLAPGPAAPAAEGTARLFFAASPFGVAVTGNGHHVYDIRITAKGLPEPASLGGYTAFVAWEVSTDLAEWRRVGTVRNGTSAVGPVDRNKFLLVITAEADSAPGMHAGPTVLHGTSPSGWLQRFLSHPLFRGISQ